MLEPTFLDRLIGNVSPAWGARRLAYRAATSAILGHYDAASVGRRSEHWITPNSGPNAASAPTLSMLRSRSRDLIRNNGFARNAVEDLETETVGTGIVPKIKGRTKTTTKRLTEHWKAHFESHDIDADGMNADSGLQALAFRTVAESGEVLIRRRLRRLSDGLALPFQLQVLEPDYLDTSRDVVRSDGTRIVGGVEFNAYGQRVAYWLLPEHPGEATGYAAPGTSKRVPAESVLHLYRVERPGQIRGVPWGASAIVRLRDVAEAQDARVVREKIAACFAVFIRKSSDSSPAAIAGLAIDPAGKKPPTERVFPGMIERLGPGDDVSFGSPPGADGFEEFERTVLRAVAAGFGTTYEALTGDYSRVNLSSARLAGLRHARRVDAWRWRILIPRMTGPVVEWAFELAGVIGLDVEGAAAVWSPPRRDLIDPKVEVVATRSEIRAGLKTLSAALRERGEDPDEVYAELASDAARLDELGLVLESDARRPSNGQPGDPRNASPNAAQEPKKGGGKAGDDDDEGDGDDEPEGA